MRHNLLSAKGNALYALYAASAPPSVPTNDPLIDYVVTVMNFQGREGTHPALDGKGHTYNYFADAVISSALIAGGALTGAGAGTRAEWVDSTGIATQPDVGDFCFEVVALSTGNFGYEVMASTAYGGTGNGIVIENSGARGLGFQANNAWILPPYVFDMNDGQVHSYALDRKAGHCRVFVDGLIVREGTNDASIAGSGMSVLNAIYDAGSTPWHGHVQGVRLTKASRYSANYAPLAMPFLTA